MSTKADKAWKVFICAQQALDAKSCASKISYLIADQRPGNLDFHAQLEFIRGKSGDEIADILLKYHDNGLSAIEAAMK